MGMRGLLLTLVLFCALVFEPECRAERPRCTSRAFQQHRSWSPTRLAVSGILLTAYSGIFIDDLERRGNPDAYRGGQAVGGLFFFAGLGVTGAGILMGVGGGFWSPPCEVDGNEKIIYTGKGKAEYSNWDEFEKDRYAQYRGERWIHAFTAGSIFGLSFFTNDSGYRNGMRIAFIAPLAMLLWNELELHSKWALFHSKESAQAFVPILDSESAGLALRLAI